MSCGTAVSAVAPLLSKSGTRGDARPTPLVPESLRGTAAPAPYGVFALAHLPGLLRGAHLLVVAPARRRYVDRMHPFLSDDPNDAVSGSPPAVNAGVPVLRLLVVRTTGIAAETLQALLDNRGALGSAIEQRRGTRLVRLQAYFPIDVDAPVDWAREKLAEMHANGVPVGPAEVRLEPLRGEDWAESWKRHFHPIRVTERLIVTPTWEDISDSEVDVIRLDPGMAFGLGDHPTTRGCLQMLERMADTRWDSDAPFATADVGCGTGILAIRAVQLGMGPVEAFDTETDAIRSARENAERNGVGDRITLRQGTMPARGAGPYQKILANIFLTVLQELLPRMVRALEERGELLAAGILGEQEERLVSSAKESGLVVIDRICERAQPGAKRWPVLRLRKEG
jgi:ribosomal protein L11 methyltransferase